MITADLGPAVVAAVLVRGLVDIVLAPTRSFGIAVVWQAARLASIGVGGSVRPQGRPGLGPGQYVFEELFGDERDLVPEDEPVRADEERLGRSGDAVVGSELAVGVEEERPDRPTLVSEGAGRLFGVEVEDLDDDGVTDGLVVGLERLEIGVFLLASTHHEAKKLSITYLPRRLASDRGAPSRVA